MEPPKIISHVTAALHAQEVSESQAMGKTGGASSDPEWWEAPDGSSRGSDCSRAVGLRPGRKGAGGRKWPFEVRVHGSRTLSLLPHSVDQSNSKTSADSRGAEGTGLHFWMG